MSNTGEGAPKYPALIERRGDSKFTAQICGEILENLELAMPIQLAVEAAGLGRTTFYNWLERGENGEEPYKTFAEQVTRARAMAAKNLTMHALRGGKGSAAATWFLERRFRDDYGPPSVKESQPAEVRITIEGGLPPRPSE